MSGGTTRPPPPAEVTRPSVWLLCSSVPPCPHSRDINGNVTGLSTRLMYASSASHSPDTSKNVRMTPKSVSSETSPLGKICPNRVARRVSQSARVGCSRRSQAAWQRGIASGGMTSLRTTYRQQSDRQRSGSKAQASEGGRAGKAAHRFVWEDSRNHARERTRTGRPAWAGRSQPPRAAAAARPRRSHRRSSSRA
jgi:hypothetical protein